MKAAGIVGPQATPKGLRHAYGIAAVEAGVPLTTIADVLGHADTNTTSIYTRATGREAREFVSRMWHQD
jgi:site-specific recombinase XerD